MKTARHRVMPLLGGLGVVLGGGSHPLLAAKTRTGVGLQSVQLLPFPAKPHSPGIGGLSCSSRGTLGVFTPLSSFPCRTEPLKTS